MWKGHPICFDEDKAEDEASDESREDEAVEEENQSEPQFRSPRRCIYRHEMEESWHLGRKLIAAKNSKQEGVCEYCVYEEEDSHNFTKKVEEARPGEVRPSREDLLEVNQMMQQLFGMK